MAMNYVSGLKAILSRGEFPSESSLFRLCYQATVAFCIGSSVFLTASEFFGNPINCLTGLEDQKNVVDTYCWIKSTFTMEDYQFRWIIFFYNAQKFVYGFRNLIAKKLIHLNNSPRANIFKLINMSEDNRFINNAINFPVTYVHHGEISYSCCLSCLWCLTGVWNIYLFR